MKQLHLDFDGPKQPQLYRECLTFADELRSKGCYGGELHGVLGIALWAYNKPADIAEAQRLFSRYFADWGQPGH